MLELNVAGNVYCDNSLMDPYHEYKKDRHAAHVSSRRGLDDLAFKTSERYDQWVLTLAGGALAISLTFLKDIAPSPVRWTLLFLGLSWLAYILAVLAGFYAIFISREAIYRQIEIGDAEYRQFRETSTKEKPEGSMLVEEKNQYVERLKSLNNASITFLATGTGLMCLFALINVATPVSDKETRQISVNVPQNITNDITIKIKNHEWQKQ